MTVTHCSIENMRFHMDNHSVILLNNNVFGLVVQGFHFANTYLALFPSHVQSVSVSIVYAALAEFLIRI